MAANAYPHIVFARDSEALPQQALADILVGLFPEAQVEQGKIKAVLTLDEEYTYTFWYDEEADGLGERYGEYAAPVRRRRVEKCTVMIDASGDADEAGTRARDVHRIMAALAERSGVYVFSEETKRFVGMDYGDGGAVPTTESGTTPDLDPRSDVSPPPSLKGGAREVALESEELSKEFTHAEQGAVDRPTDDHAPAQGDPTGPGYAVPPVPVSGASLADPGAQSTDVTIEEEQRILRSEDRGDDTVGGDHGRAETEPGTRRDPQHVDRAESDEAGDPSVTEGRTEDRSEESYRAEPGEGTSERHTVAGDEGRTQGEQQTDQQTDQEKPGLLKRLFGRRR